MRLSDDNDLFDPQPQGLLFSMFGAYLQPRSARIWSGGLVTLLEYFGITTAAARIALSRLVLRGLAERERVGRNIYYTLTPRSLHLLEDADSRLSSLGKPHDPDTTWTIVWHNLPDSRKVERTNLIKQIRFHGFGQLQDCVWISPGDYVTEITQLVRTLGVQDAVALFRANPASDMTGGPLLDHVWRLDEVERRYRWFVSRYGRLVRKRGLSERQALVACTELVHTFHSFADIDPELPTQWATHREAREQAVDVFQRAFEHLREPASAHFRELTR